MEPTTHHSNGPMLLLSAVISAVTYLFTSAVSGEVIHILSALVTCIAVFLLQKLMHFLWDKYITKKKNNGKN